MHPQLLKIPFINFAIPSYGFMMIMGFFAGLLVARYRSRQMGENPEQVSNFAVWALLAGVVGARIFHVIHNWSDSYRDNPWEVFAIWSGGLEFLGGFLAAMLVMVIYFRRRRLSVMKYLDILAPTLMLGLAFGRIGCFLNGCCFGAPSDLPWSVRFPPLREIAAPGCHKATISQYSYPFSYQLYPDNDRRPGQPPLLQLPDDYYYPGWTDGQSHWVDNAEQIPPRQKKLYYRAPLPIESLSESQIAALKNGTYRMLPIHPAQIYSSLAALSIALFLHLLTARRRREGQIFALMLILYGIARFYLESLRTSSPYEFDGLTISQNLSLIAAAAGVVLLAILRRWGKSPITAQPGKPKPIANKS